MNWRDVGMPEHICIRQNAFERRQRVLVAIQGGAKLSDIARKMGVSTARVAGLRDSALRDVARGCLAPVHVWLKEGSHMDLVHLASGSKRRTT